MKKLLLLVMLSVVLALSGLLTGCNLFASQLVEQGAEDPKENSKPKESKASATDADKTYTGKQKEARYNARYIFEQQALPRFVYKNAAEFIECFKNSDFVTADLEIRAMWKYTAEEYLITLFGSEEAEYAAKGERQLYELLDKMTLEYGLGAQHLRASSLEKIDSKTSCILIEMQELDEELLCAYIAIVYSEADGLRYHTLERIMSPSDDRKYMFCFVGQEKRGSLGLVDNDKESVLNAIRALNQK